MSLAYPFKSKYKYVSDNLTPYFSDIKLEQTIPDYKLKVAKKLSKPDFSNQPGCWEADLMFVNSKGNLQTTSEEEEEDTSPKSLRQIYLVMINVSYC